MSLADHITGISIQSSLESIADRCAVTMFFAPTDLGFSEIPDKNSEFTATITVNDTETLEFLGIVKEREFSKSKDGYIVTLHMYDRGIYLLDANFDSKYKMTIIPEEECDKPQITNTVDIVEEARKLIETAAGFAISIFWKFPHYNVMTPLILRAPVASILQELSSYFSLSEIQKVVLYANEGGAIVCKKLDLWESRLTNPIELADRHIIQLTIGETPLPIIRKARITGGAKHKIIWSSDHPASVSQLSSDRYGRKTEVLTITKFDTIGRVSSIVTEISMDDNNVTWGRLLMTRESVEYVYDPCTGKLINETSITTQWSYTGIATEAPTIIYSWDQLRSFVEYKYMDIKFGDEDEVDAVRLSAQITTTEERKIGNILTKTTREVISYTELAKGLTQRRTEFWQRGPRGFAIDPIKLISSSTDIYYGEPPGPLESPSGPEQKQHLSKRTELLAGSTAGYFFDFSNPNIIDEAGFGGPFGEGAFEILIGQLREMSGATRLDISVNLIGYPFIRKGDIIEVEDVRKSGNEKIKAVVIEVNNSVSIGAEYITSIRAVSYQS